MTFVVFICWRYTSTTCALCSVVIHQFDLTISLEPFVFDIESCTSTSCGTTYEGSTIRSTYNTVILTREENCSTARPALLTSREEKEVYGLVQLRVNCHGQSQELVRALLLVESIS